jgi:chromosome segregation ATPase
VKKDELYREGARLPEQLSRLLFVDGMVMGRRVLEVGTRSDALARMLLELGASRVVCASYDKELIDERRANNHIDRIDHRLVRPGVLPGDDGAFDLVIDFDLAAALARGDTFRATEINRLLSAEGFAISALTNPTALGLSTLLPGPAAEPAVGYKPFVDSLKLHFELVQVYFQSLLLGYLFGSFDADSSGDGIAPQTQLMEEAEPAGAYVFAFGNAVPVIDDVAFVQVPFDPLLSQFRRLQDAVAQHVQPTAATVTDDSIVAALRAEMEAQQLSHDHEASDAEVRFGTLLRRATELESTVLVRDNAVRALESDLSASQERIAALESDAVRLATAVQSLVAERSRGREEQDGQAQLQQQLEEVRQQLSAALQSSQEAQEQHSRQRRHDRELLEKSGRELAEAKQQETEALAQRQVLETVLHDRDAQLAVAQEALASAQLDAQRHRHAADDQVQLLATAEQDLQRMVAQLLATEQAAAETASLLVMHQQASQQYAQDAEQRSMLLEQRLEQQAESLAQALNGSAHQRQQLEEQLSSLLRSQDGYDAERGQWQTIRQSLEHQLAEAERARSSLQQQSVLLDGERAALQQQLIAAELRLESDRVGFDEQRQSWAMQLADLNSEKSALEQARHAMQQHIDELAANQHAFQQELANVEERQSTERARWQQELASVSDRAQQLEQQHATVQQELLAAHAHAEQQSNQLRQETAELVLARNDATAKLEQLTGDRDSLQSQLAADAMAAQTTSAELRAQLVVHEENIVAGLHRLEQQQSELVVLQAALAERDATIAEVQAQTEAARLHLQAEVAGLRHEVAELDRTRSQTRDEVDAMRAAGLVLHDQLEALRQRERTLVAEAATEAAGYETELARLSADHEAAQRDALALADAALRRERAELQAHHEHTSAAAKAGWENERAVLTESHTQQTVAAQQEAQSHRTRADQLGKDIAAMRQEATMRAAHEAELERKLGAAERASEDAVLQWQQATVAGESALAHAQQLTEQAHQRITLLEQEMSAAAHRRDELEARCHDLEQERNAANRAVEQHVALLAEANHHAASAAAIASEELAGLRAQQAGLQSDVEAALAMAAAVEQTGQATMAAATAHVQRIRALEEERDMLSLQVQEAAQAEHAVAQLRMQLSGVEQAAADQHAQQQARIAVLEEELQRLSVARDSLVARAAQAADQYTQQQARIAVLEEELQRLSVARDEMAARAAEQLRDVAQAAEQHAQQQSHIAALEDELQRAAAARDSLADGSAQRLSMVEQAAADHSAQQQSRIAALEEEMQRLVAARDVLNNTLAEARTLLDVERARGDLFGDELKEATEALLTEHTRGELFHAELMEAQSTLLSLRRRLGESAEQVFEVRRQLRSASQTMEGEAVRVQLSEEQLERGVARSEQLSASLDEAQVLLADKAAEVELLRQHLDEARASYERHRVEAVDASTRLKAALKTARGESTAHRQLAEERVQLLAMLEEEKLRVAASTKAHQHMREQLMALQQDAARRLSEAEAEQTRLVKLLRDKEADDAQARAVPAPVFAPDDSAIVAALQQRLAQLEQVNAQKDAVVAEQQDRIHRLTERIVRDAGFRP